MRFSRSILFGLGLLLSGNSSRPIDINKFYRDLNNAGSKPQFLNLLNQIDFTAEEAEILLEAIENKLLTVPMGLKCLIQDEINNYKYKQVCIAQLENANNSDSIDDEYSILNETVESQQSITTSAGYKTFKNELLSSIREKPYSIDQLEKLKKILINFQKKLNQPDIYADITHEMKLNTARMIAEIDFELQRKTR